MLKKTCLVLLLVFIVFSLTGCGTVQGVGDDIKWVGEKGAEIIEPQ